MAFKPGDFLFGLMEFLAFIVPGMILFATLPVVTLWNAPAYFNVINTGDITPFTWVVFILTSYVYGHFIHHISALIFNPIYVKLYYRYKKSKHAPFIESTEKIISNKFPSNVDLIRIAEAFIRCEQPSLIAGLERHEANSKLFRALTILCIYLCFYPKLGWFGIIILLIMSFLSFLKFSNERWTHRLLIYEYFNLLNNKDSSK